LKYFIAILKNYEFLPKIKAIVNRSGLMLMESTVPTEKAFSSFTLDQACELVAPNSCKLALLTPVRIELPATKLLAGG
jgi:hypothetical protein